MQGSPVKYLGRSVAMEGFRAFVYGPNGQKKLVNNWSEFEIAMGSGLWFSSKEEAETSLVQEDVTVDTKLKDDLREDGRKKRSK